MPNCPICKKEASEAEINTHLDKGCTSVRQKKLFSFDTFGPDTKKRGSDSIIIDDDDFSSPKIENVDKKMKLSATSSSPAMRASENKPVVGLSFIPLAEQVRPKTLDDYVGQQDLIGPQGLLRSFVQKDVCPSMILWGPSGVGKTTFARILARATKCRFVELSATQHGVNEAKKVVEESKSEQRLLGRRTILFLDEIHRYNRAQQDIFLPSVEKGDIILIGATTENPSFKLNGALLSRCRVFVLHKLSQENIRTILEHSLKILNTNRKTDSLPLISYDQETVDYLAGLADGDGRIAINLLEIALAGLPTSSESDELVLDKDSVKSKLQRTHMLYDRVGDSHYDTISAFHKSVRGGDINATLFYLGRMLEAGEDPVYVARRMVRMASEDIGLADDSLLPFAVSTFTAVQQLGMPEADVILAHCAVKLAKAKKSVMVYKAYNAVKRLLHDEPGAAAAPIPLHIRNAPTKLMKDLNYGKEYKYNPDYINGEVDQDYLPEGFKHVQFMPDKHLGDLIDTDLEKRRISTKARNK